MPRHVRSAYERIVRRAQEGWAVASGLSSDDAQRRTLKMESHRLQQDLLLKAMEDPELAHVLDVYENGYRDTSPGRQKQYLFAEAVYRNYFIAWSVGNITYAELFGHVRVLIQNDVFREYWHAARHQRASLPDDSEESEAGRMVDALLADLEDADVEEWWVVGEPPVE
ncbi:hypothetical protein G5C60_25665 [Streptomyces sp. HC44]|uniref:Uncharacterized protein n=2 Tax=Streptomyces scabichelini TaxID=2711217 RepID=A0A6G4VAQ9_9ACTN|nr:hypothetical protein [Streptomyces scabichelini]